MKRDQQNIKLPVEILNAIFRYVPPRYLFESMLVCKARNQVAGALAYEMIVIDSDKKYNIFISNQFNGSNNRLYIQKILFRKRYYGSSK
jgi:hypothetical protein